MRSLQEHEMLCIEGGDAADKICGLAIGAVVVGSIVFGGIGFALTINKALAACTIAAAT